MVLFIVILMHVIYGGMLHAVVPKSYTAVYEQQSMTKFAVIAVACYHGIWITWLLENLFQSNMVPLPQIIVGIVAFFQGAAWLIWARQSNPFFIPNVKIPGKVVSTGAYACLRHPGYLGMAMMAGGTYLLLGHRTGIIPLLIYWSMICYRIREENQLLYE